MGYGAKTDHALVYIQHTNSESVVHLKQQEEQSSLQAEGLGVNMNTSCSHSCTTEPQKTLHSLAASPVQ